MMQKKYISYFDRTIYAIFYRNIHTIFYNVDFNGETQIIVYKLQ